MKGGKLSVLEVFLFFNFIFERYLSVYMKNNQNGAQSLRQLSHLLNPFFVHLPLTGYYIKGGKTFTVFLSGLSCNKLISTSS